MQAKIDRARVDVNAFIELIGEGPGGRRMRQDRVHRIWQKYWGQRKRSVLLAPVGHGKTSQLRHRLLWMIGRDPNIQIVFVSGTERHPKKVLRAIKSEIEQNKRVQWVFPDLAAGGVWTTTEMQVKRDTREGDPTIQIFGAFSGSVLGTRADVVVFDDLCNFGNTFSELSREKMSDWCGSVVSRLKPTAKVIAIGHIWHEHDQLQRFRRKRNWGYKRYEATRTNDIGEEVPLAPGVMTLDDIREKEDDLGPIRAPMMLRNRLPARGVGRFKEGMFRRCLARGRGLGFLPRMVGVPTYTGVDLGHRKEPGKDRTCIFTVAVLPDATRQVIDIRSGLWTAMEILRQIKAVQLAFGSIVAVENNSAQNYLLDVAAELDCMPIRPHHTGPTNKHDLSHGVEALSLELDQGVWMLPCDGETMIPPEEMGAAIQEGLGYNPKAHTGDRLMAWWICKEAIRLSPAAPRQGIPLESTEDLLGR